MKNFDQSRYLRSLLTRNTSIDQIVQQMLEERPMRFEEILEAVAPDKHATVRGVILRLQRKGVRVVDVAPAGSAKAMWFIPDAEAFNRLTLKRLARVLRMSRM